MASHVVCSEAFVSGLPPEQIYADTVVPLSGMGPFSGALRVDVDRSGRQVTAKVAGAFESRAVYHDGLGCLLVHGDEPADTSAPRDVEGSGPPALPEIAGPEVVETLDPRLRTALDRAFTEAAAPPYHGTKAIVVVRDGIVVAERYAPGYGVQTPLVGWSVAKSITSALVGILIRDRRLSVDSPAPLPAWSDPRDPRHAITVDQLLRQTSGLMLTQTNSGFDPSTRMKFVERDMAAFAAAATLEARPGTRWAYTDGHYMLLSRIVRDAVGGHAADVIAFAQRELFGPLGMRGVTIEFDATGTPLGAYFLFAPARAWARFGLLYLNDGIAGGRRILPEGWVRYSTTPTLDTGYGAGFWTNLANGNVPQWGVPWGMAHAPRDTFFARGFMGQYIVVVPSERLVVARFGVSHVKGDDIEGTDSLVADVVAALHPGPGSPR
jgi:CubicO group peptidase (beta-lactamase class C family)